jgi:hypothetical protein
VFPWVIYFYRFSYLRLFVVTIFVPSYKHFDPGGLRSEAYFCSRSIVGIADSNPPDGLGARVLLFVVCCVGSSGLCDGLITRIEECYRVCVCDLEISAVGRPGSHWGCCDTEQTRPSAVPVAARGRKIVR